MAKQYHEYNPINSRGFKKPQFVDSLQSDDDYQKVVNYLIKKKNKRNLAMFVTASSFAMRITDVLNLTWKFILNEDYSLKSEMTIQESKRRKVRTVTFPDLFIQTIKLYINSLKEQNKSFTLTDYVFPSQKGGSKPMLVSNTCKMFKKIFKESGCNPDYNYCTHTMRKTKGSFLYKKGYDIVKISKLLGHSDLNQTMQYIGITKKDIKEMYLDTFDNIKL